MRISEKLIKQEEKETRILAVKTGLELIQFLSESGADEEKIRETRELVNDLYSTFNKTNKVEIIEDSTQDFKGFDRSETDFSDFEIFTKPLEVVECIK